MVEILTSSDLLKQQLEVESLKKPNKEPKPVDISKSTGISFNARLQRLTRSIKKDIDTTLIPLLRKLQPEYQTRDSMQTMDTWVTDITNELNALISKWMGVNATAIYEGLATQFVREANAVNERRFNASMKSFGIDVFGDYPEINEYLEASVWDNTQLIKSIPEQYLRQVENIVMTNVRAGNRSSAMVKTLQQQFGVTERRARFIARDQTSKINGDLSAKRQQSVGYEYFQWNTSEDQRVRERHDQISDKVTEYGKGVYRWDNPPIGENGTPIIPGQSYNCRCTSTPVSNVQVKRNQENGDTKKGVKR